MTTRRNEVTRKEARMGGMERHERSVMGPSHVSLTRAMSFIPHSSPPSSVPRSLLTSFARTSS